MSTTPIAGAAQQQTTTPPANPLGQLGKDAFLKLLAVQLQNQDPSNPMNNQEFMGQMAQFSALEETTNMAQGLTQMAFAGQVGQAVELIGHTVGYMKSGTPAEGKAESVSVQDGQIKVKVGTDLVSPSEVTFVGGAS